MRPIQCHITIEKFQLSKVAKAIRDILDFQEEEEKYQKTQTNLSLTIGGTLISFNNFYIDNFLKI